jgi:5'(3')-deoxyribonucleotidase
VAIKRFVFGVDLDGVVADFYGALRPLAADWFDVPIDTLPEEVSFGLPEWGVQTPERYEELHRWALTQRRLFAELKPVQLAGPVLRRLSQEHEVHIRIITHRLFISHFHELQIVQTVEWLERYGIPYRDLCFMADKAAVGADLYIDDNPDNVVSLRAAGHHTIVFTNSTNRAVTGGPRADTWLDVERIVVDAQATWRAKPQPSDISGN